MLFLRGVFSNKNGLKQNFEFHVVSNLLPSCVPKIVLQNSLKQRPDENSSILQ